LIPEQDTSQKSLVFLRIVKWHWVIIAIVILGILAMEIIENEPTDSFVRHIPEYILYITIMLVIGVLIDLLKKSLDQQKQMLNIIDTKHKISRELSRFDLWNDLVEALLHLPSQLAPVTGTVLYLQDPITHLFEQAACWGETPAAAIPPACQECILNNLDTRLQFSLCRLCSKEGKNQADSLHYYLPLAHGNTLLAVMQILVTPGRNLTKQQENIFQNIGDDLGVALKLCQDRRTTEDLRLAETTLNERRKVSHYLHDHLGQNLGYLQLKLGQFKDDVGRLTEEHAQSDLQRMVEVANDSYKIVRGILETTQVETTLDLTNMLREYAQKIGQRANIQVIIQTSGKPAPICIDTQRAVFYAFQELLRNIEKHAQATKAEICAEWSADALKITITDDGIGFLPQAVDTGRHFGLGIVQERMTQVNGRIEISTNEKAGTRVVISAPLG
jgi:nitrate/nitrite-specific signal transduction histidine kinase